MPNNASFRRRPFRAMHAITGLLLLGALGALGACSAITDDTTDTADELRKDAPVVKVTSDAASVTFTVSYSASATSAQVFIDTDRNKATGSAVGTIGADLSIQNGVLSRFANGSWTQVKPVTVQSSAGNLVAVVARTDLGSPTSIDVVAVSSPPTRTSAKVTADLSSSTAADAGTGTDSSTTAPATPPPGAFEVKNYGAACDGTTNDTDAFYAASQALAKQGGGTLWLPPGATCIVGKQTFTAGTGYRPSPIISIRNCANPVVIAGNGAHLRAAAGLHFGSFDPNTGLRYDPTLPFTNYAYAADAYTMIGVSGNASVTITDVELDGRIDTLILGGQWGDTGRQLQATGISAAGNKNLTIQRVYTHHHGLDGVMVGYAGLTATSAPTPTLLEDVVSDFNARQGFSWVGGIGLTVRNSKFMNTGKAVFGSAPGAGVDIEAEDSVNRNALFENCEMTNNSGVGLVADSGDSANITVRNTAIWGTTSWSIWPKKPYMRFEGCNIHGAGVNLYGSTTDPASAAQFVDTTFDDAPHPVYGKAYNSLLLDLGGGSNPNVTFDHCSFTATHGKSVYVDNNPAYPVVFKNGTTITHGFLAPAGDFLGVLRGVRLENVHFMEAFPSTPSGKYYVATGGDVVGNNVVVDGPYVGVFGRIGTIPPGNY